MIWLVMYLQSIGKGVFAYDEHQTPGSQVFDRDQVIMYYVGEHITNNEASRSMVITTILTL